MTPQVPSIRLDPKSQPAAGIQRRPSEPLQASKDEASSARARANETQDQSSGIQIKVQRHSQWVLLSQAQSQLARLQGTERSLIASYRELASLSRELERSGSETHQLAQRVRRLKARLEREGQMDGNLQPRQIPARANYILDRIDLLRPREQNERLNIRLPNGAHIALQIPAGGNPRDTLTQLSTQLRRHDIEVSDNGRGQLRLSGTAELLSSPWLFQGQGVRVPAGNPVTIQLAEEDDQLKQLADGLERSDSSQERQRLRALLANLEQQRRELENQRQELLRKVAQLRAEAKASDADAHSELSESLKKTLKDGDFILQLNALLAQATLSRMSVVALLGR